jgi:4'-phosphopantetheinyl transferase
MLSVTVHEWGAPQSCVDLARDAVHVWRVNLDSPDHDLDAFAALLDEEERERAVHLRRDDLRRRFVVRRGVLRCLLARYLGTAAQSIRYVVGKRGKLRLRALAAQSPLHFNVSDADALAVYGLTRVGEIGIDVEKPLPFEDLAVVAQRWFSPREQAAVASLPTEEQISGFYTGWTRKEAIVKAIGTGIGFPLERFSVSLTPGSPAAILEAQDDRVRDLQLLAVPVPQPFIAACAVQLGKTGAS